MTASLIAALDDTITVEYGRIVLQDTNRINSPLALMAASEDWLVMGGPGGLLLHSAGSDHLPAVRVEIWSEEPVSSGEWDAVEIVQCELLEGVRLESVTAEQSKKALAVAVSGLHSARVHVAGRRKTAKLREGSFAKNKERWLIQLWPTDA